MAEQVVQEVNQVHDNGKGFRFVCLWKVDKYDKRDKFTFILSKGTVLVREHHEYAFGFDMQGDLLIVTKAQHSAHLMFNGSGMYDLEIEGWHIKATDPMVIELKKILADEAIHQVVLGGT